MEKSCGTIPFIYENNELKFLVIRQNSGHWGFPKGHVEKNETEQETAIRETKEETNIDVLIVLDFRYREEYFVETKNVRKEVIYFLANPLNDNVVLQSEELQDYTWLSYDDAINTLTYDNSKELLKTAYEYIIKNELR